MADLSKKFGKNQAFKDDELFEEIAAMTYPEIGEFLKTYVGGNKPLPYAEIYQKVGVKYVPEEKYMDVDLGISQAVIGVNPAEGTIFINNIAGLNDFGKALGFEQGDVIKKINGQDFPPLGPQIGPFIGARQAELEIGKPFSYTVLRNGEEVKLEAEVIQIEKSRVHQIAFDENATEKQLKIRKSWLKP